jgi:hypothetical protein
VRLLKVVSLPSSGNVRIELRLKNKLSNAITCLIYAEYENSIYVDIDKRILQTFKLIDTVQIQNVLQHVPHFNGVFPSDMLPSEFTRPATFVCNLDAHNRPGSHWIAITFRDKYSAWYFDTYGLPPIVKSLDDFLRHNTAHFTYNHHHQLQNIASDICGQYVCTLHTSAQNIAT